MKKHIIMTAAIFILLSLGAGALETTLPIFENGRIVAMKEGYFTAVKEYSTGLGESGSVELTLEPYRYKNVTVKKYEIKKVPVTYGSGDFTYTRYEWKFGENPAVGLSANEKAILSITKIKENPYEDDFFNVVIWSEGQVPEEIKLIPGKYEVELSLYYEPFSSSIVIPEDKVCYRKCPVVCSKRCVSIPPIEFDKILPEGTVQYIWDLRNSQMDNAEKKNIEFYAVAVDIAGTPAAERRHKDLELLDSINDYVADYSILKPEFK